LEKPGGINVAEVDYPILILSVGMTLSMRRRIDELPSPSTLSTAEYRTASGPLLGRDCDSALTWRRAATP